MSQSTLHQTGLKNGAVLANALEVATRSLINVTKTSDNTAGGFDLENSMQAKEVYALIASRTVAKLKEGDKNVK